MRNDARERALRARAVGNVLELRPGVSLDALVAEGARFDTIVSIFQLARSDDPARDLRAMERLLAEDGRVLLLEPTSTPGVAGALQRVAGRRRHDIPALVRAAGLSMRDCDRIHTPAGAYVEIDAFRTIFPARTGAARP